MSRPEGPQSRLDPEKLRAGLKDVKIGREVIVLDEVGSTNDFLFDLATPEMPEGLVVFAERQIAGRGQHGNRWDSAAGLGLWLSILLRPHAEPASAARLTTWAAETVARVVRNEARAPAVVKPPNDVCVDGRKVAGVLLEMRVGRDGEYVAILGIGLNVSHSPDDFPAELRDRAASLAMFADAPIDRQALACALLRELDRTYKAGL